MKNMDKYWKMLKHFLKFALLVLFIFWLLLEIFLSRETAKGTITVTEDEMREMCLDAFVTNEDTDLVARLQRVLDGMLQGEFLLTGKSAEDFGSTYILSESGEAPSDLRVVERVYFNSDRNCGYIRYKWGLDWIVQLDFSRDANYVCKSIESYGNKKFGGNVLVYAWNHSIAKFLWHHPRYLCTIYDRGSRGVDVTYERQTIGHYWFSFLGERVEKGELARFVSKDVNG